MIFHIMYFFVCIFDRCKHSLVYSTLLILIISDLPLLVTVALAANDQHFKFRLFAAAVYGVCSVCSHIHICCVLRCKDQHAKRFHSESELCTGYRVINYWLHGEI